MAFQHPDLFADRPLTARPATPGRADGPFLAAVAEQHPYLASRADITEACRTMRPTDDPNASDDPLQPHFLQSIVAREGGANWVWNERTDGLPRWVGRMISEIIAPSADLRVCPDRDDPGNPDKATLYRRALPDCIVSKEPSGWLPVGNLKAAYRGGKKDDVPGIDSWVKDALLLAGQTIRRGLCFKCTDGEIRYEHSDEYGGWCETRPVDGRMGTFLGARDFECKNDSFQPLTGQGQMERKDTLPSDKPMTYTWETGMTVGAAINTAMAAAGIMRNWTGRSEGSFWNFIRMPAAAFMRSHPELAYVAQGGGGGGKSLFVGDLMTHLAGQAMTMSLDLLGQPTAMSAENTMGELTSHLLAVTDDYDPRRGRFEKIIGPLKTLLTGLLPFSARRIGENTFDGKPQAVHVITTNSHLPIGDSAAEQRRFAFYTIQDNESHDALHAYLEFKGENGFWPFMLASAHAWVQAGDKPFQDTAYVDLDDLNDTEIDMVRQAMNGLDVIPDPTQRVSWRSLGMQRATTVHDGKKTTCYRPFPKDVNPSMHSVWMAVSTKVKAMDDQVNAFVAPPIPNNTLGDDVDEWADRLAKAGAAPTLFPCYDKPVLDKAGKVIHDVKQPDGASLWRATGVGSWQKAARDPDVAKRLRQRTDRSMPCWGMTMSRGYLWLDLDCHSADAVNGWTHVNEEVGRYGGEDLPRTFAVRTPSGGVHLLYKYDPDTLKVENKANADKQADTRVGGDGYVIAGGSTTANGAYTPIDTPADPAHVPELTPKLTAWLTANGYVRGAAGHRTTPSAPNPTAGGSTPENTGRNAILDDLLNPGERPVADYRKTHGQPNMSVITPGERNDTLYGWASGRHIHYPQDCARIDQDVIERGTASGLSVTECKDIVKSIHNKLANEKKEKDKRG